MIGELSSVRLFDGYRGGAPADRTALAEIVTTLSQLMIRVDRIAEMDVNPLRWDPRSNELIALDALIVLR